jgi:hypothetical protein
MEMPTRLGGALGLGRFHQPVVAKPLNRHHAVPICLK